VVVIVDILLAELRSSSTVIEIVTEVVETESGGTMIVGVTVVEVFLAATASNTIQNALKIKMGISIFPTTSDDAMGGIASVKNAPDKNAQDNKTKLMTRTTANHHGRRLCRTGLRQENSKSMWLKGFQFLSRGQSSGR
jgi:hypothetical protein